MGYTVGIYEGYFYCRSVNDVRPIKFSVKYRDDGDNWLITILSFTGAFLRRDCPWYEVNSRDMILSSHAVYTIVRDSGSLRQDKSKSYLFKDGKISFYAQEVPR